MTIEEFLMLISEGLKKSIRKEDVFGDDIDLRVLKRIDKVFNKGLHYYLDSEPPQISKEASIFFAKLILVQN